MTMINTGQTHEFRNNTYALISTVAYLIGVPWRFFDNETEPPDPAVYTRLQQNKNARIIRHLCVVRTAIEQNFKRINDKMRFENRSLLSMPECIPTESLQQLSEDGVEFIKKTSTKLYQHIIELNRLIADRINNCKPLFPLWINWDYIKPLFIMPNGLTEEGTRDAAAMYYANKDLYPYRMYINWKPVNEGNILYNDAKFASLLYQWNNDYFSEHNKVSDAGSYIKNSIYDFLAEGRRIVVLVDCENSDPYQLSAVFKNLDRNYLDKVERVILFDDIHTASAWRILERTTQLTVEHNMIDRLKQDKSLVDIRLTARACQEFYQNKVDSFILVSSDSDFWGLISSMPEASFLVMVEREKCGPDIKKALVSSGIFYCYIDDFYSGNAMELQQNALFDEMYRYLEQTVQLNVNDMLDNALRATRLQMTQSERSRFFDKHIRNMKLNINDDGEVSFELKR